MTCAFPVAVKGKLMLTAIQEHANISKRSAVCLGFNSQKYSVKSILNKKLSCHRGTARRTISVKNLVNC